MTPVSAKLGLRPRFPGFKFTVIPWPAFTTVTKCKLQWCQVIPKYLSFEQRKVYCRAKPEERMAHAPKPWTPQMVSKDQVREGEVTGYVISLCTIHWLADVEVTEWVTLSVLRCQKVWGLCAHIYQVVNFFHLVVVLASEKFWKYAQDTII